MTFSYIDMSYVICSIRIIQTCLPHYWYIIAPLRCEKQKTMYYVGNTGGGQPIWLPGKEAIGRIPYACVGVLFVAVPFCSLVYFVDVPKLAVSLLAWIPFIRTTDILTKATRNAPGNPMGRVRQCMISTGELRFRE